MYLALREMRHAKVRYALIAAILLLVSLLVLFVTGLARGLAHDNAASIQNMAATHFVLQEHSEHRMTRSQVGDSELKQVRAVVGEANGTPLALKLTAVTAAGSEQKTDVAMLAVDMKGWLTPKVAEGQTISNDVQGEVLVDKRLADDGAAIGSELIDGSSGMRFKVVGFVRDQSFSHAPAVYVSMSDWRLLQSKMGGTPQDGYNAIALQADGDQAKKLKEQLTKSEMITKTEAVSAIPGYKEEQGSLTMMIFFLYFISAIVLGVFFYIITIQKTGQFGVLKALGTKTGYLVRSVVGQVALLMTGSLAVSLLLIEIMARLLPATMPFQLDTNTIVLTCAAFAAMALVGSLLSVAKVVKIDALDAIGRAGA